MFHVEHKQKKRGVLFMNKKFFGTVSTLEELKKAYKKLAVKLHPDNNGGKDEDFKKMQNEYDKLYQSLFHTQNKKSKTNASYEDIRKESDIFKDIIDKLIHFNINIDIVGTWIWVYGDTYQCKEILKSLGFSWASKKKKWYYHDINDGWLKKGRTLNYEEITSLHGCDSIKEAKRTTKKQKTMIA